MFTQNGPAGRHDEVELYELAESQPAEHASTSGKMYALISFPRKVAHLKTYHT